ncbi:hypothetical protein B0H13DRAFT_2487110 [Mycena leptocephala]|nr:hypothetical protein B0H13DRAFT_2487110 [Mycena leptocephala]
MLITLETDRIRLADIEAEILDLERSIATLRAEKAQVQGRLDSYKYPVLTLPNEIVSEIFIHFLPPYPQCPPLSGSLSPNTLVRICRQWREVALDTPALWRAIRLSDRRIQSVEIQRHIADTWLRRSRFRPLSIVFEFLYLDPDFRTSELFATLIRHRARWEHLKLTLSPSDLLAISLEESMPLLRYLHLFLAAPTVFAFPDAPLLRQVILDDSAARSVTLPWVQLTSLTLHYAYEKDSMRILQQTVNLVHCELYLRDDDQPQTDSDITLPRLESLILDLVFINYISTATGFLDALIVPALRTLRIREEFLGSSPISSLTSFISRSACNLQEVCIVNRHLVRPGLYREAFPSIPTFSFR